jgi:hypothetical protein
MVGRALRARQYPANIEHRTRLRPSASPGQASNIFHNFDEAESEICII